MNTLKKMLVLLAHALILWGLCAAVMGIGMAVLPLQTTLIIHAAAAPVFSVAVSGFYYRKFGYTTPLLTAAVFIAVVILIDFFFVALVINRSLDMFKNVVGTWLPFALIFSATYVTGLILGKRKPPL